MAVEEVPDLSRVIIVLYGEEALRAECNILLSQKIGVQTQCLFFSFWHK